MSLNERIAGFWDAAADTFDVEAGHRVVAVDLSARMVERGAGWTCSGRAAAWS